MVTNSQIEELRSEAAVAGDQAMSAIARVALGDDPADVCDDFGFRGQAWARIAYLSRDEARAECERAIRAAEGRS